MGLLCFVRAVGMDIARNKTLVKYITEFPTYKSVSLEGGTMCSRYVRPPFPRRLARFSPDVRRLRHGAVRLLEAGHLEAPGAGPAAADGSGQPGQRNDRQGGRGPRRHRLEDRLRGGGTRPWVRREADEVDCPFLGCPSACQVVVRWVDQTVGLSASPPVRPAPCPGVNPDVCQATGRSVSHLPRSCLKGNA